MRGHRNDLLLAAAVLALAAAVWLFFSRPGGDGAWAVVTVDGAEVGRYALDEDRTVTIGEEDYNVLEISGGRAAVVEATEDGWFSQLGTRGDRDILRAMLHRARTIKETIDQDG